MLTKMRYRVFIIFLLMISYSGLVSQEVRFCSDYVLHLESENGFLVDDDTYSALRNIESTVKKTVEKALQEELSADELLKAVYITINDSLGISFQFQQTLSSCLRTNTMDCNYFSLIYHSVLNHQLGLPIVPVLSPGHMFIRWNNSDGTHINFETTSGVTFTDEEHINYKGIHKKALENGIYMAPLSEEEAIATCFVEMSTEMLIDDLSRSGELCQKALSLFPGCSLAYNNYGLVCNRRGDFEEAEQYFMKVLESDPADAFALNSVGYIFSRTDRAAEAISLYSKAISGKSDDPAVYINRCVEYYYSGDYEHAMEDFLKAFEAAGKEGDALDVYLSMKLLEDMIVNHVVVARENILVLPVQKLGEVEF